MASVEVQQRKWWKECVVYQIWPYSFFDSNGDGIGDIPGITSKLSYLKQLGVDVIWLSPIYASPMVDMGYDISDYRAINPDLGTMADFEELTRETHRLGMKLVMDLVVNHTSDRHEWFKNSRANGDKRDWYVWKPARDGKEPNNWGAIFGGSCWHFDDSRQEYFLHVFDKTQPDLNWENGEVRQAVWDIMNFWLEKGCDGFRMDVINCISKEPGFPDVPIIDPTQDFQYGLLYRFNGPKMQTYLQEMHDQVLQHHPDIFTVGETPGVAKPEQAIDYVRHGNPLQMIFHFEHMYIDHMPGKTCFYKRDWKLTELKDILGKFMFYMQEHDGWDSLYLENHDQPRIVGRYADDQEHRVESAKMLALFHATGRGTLFLYQGQEIGMTNPKSWSFDELRDVEEINHYNAIRASRGEGADMQDVLADIRRIGRDNARTPVCWNDSTNAGFTSGTPWIKVNEDYRECNVELQTGDEQSVLEFWRKVLLIRSQEPGLIYGKLELIDWQSEKVYAYTRTAANAVFLIVCHFGDEPMKWTGFEGERGTLLLSNYSEQKEDKAMQLRPYECRLYRK